MALNPDIQVKAQEELTLAVGPERLPTFDDYDALPYVRAILLECARWLPPLPFAFPHCSTADDYYGGYFIPEGTNVFVVCLSSSLSSRRRSDWALTERLVCDGTS